MARIRASDVTPRPINWLWPNFLASGKFHILAGDAGTGKTTLALRIAAAISAGQTLPGSSAAPAPASVIVLSTEDDTHDVLTPRLAAAGADLTRIEFAHTLRDIIEAPPADLRLVLVDPIISIIEGNTNSNEAVRAGLQPLISLGQRTGAAVLGLTHLTKGTAKGADDSAASVFSRITGSLAFGAAARVAWHVKPSSPGASVTVIKSNIGTIGGGVQYRIDQRDGASVALWPGEKQPPAPIPAASGVNISEPDDFLDEWFEKELAAHA